MDCGLVALYKLNFTYIPHEAELSLIKIDFNYWLLRSQVTNLLRHSRLEIFKIVVLNSDRFADNYCNIIIYLSSNARYHSIRP